MKILYDHQTFTSQQYGGISRYFFELIKRFNYNESSCKVATIFSDNAYYNKNFNANLYSASNYFHFKGKKRITSYLNKKKSLSAIQRGDFNVFHPTYYDDYFFDKLKNRPFVVTCHDMVHEKFSGEFDALKSDFKTVDFKKRLIEHSSRIIAISETTKKDILNFYDVDSSKIDVVYHGSSIQNFKIGEKRLVAEDYVLFVGDRHVYKNFNLFISALADLLLENNVKLICAGGGDFTLVEQDLLISLGIENHVFFKKIMNDDALANYYTNALFFVFPSLYEGFGIPVLEAFACGCPVLLSNGGSLPEVGGEAALYFDPTNIDSLRSAASELLGNQKLRQTLKDKGFIRLKKFSWDYTFLETLEVYNSVIQ